MQKRVWMFGCTLAAMLLVCGSATSEPYPTVVREAFLNECVSSCGSPECKPICECVLGKMEAVVPLKTLESGKIDDALMEQMAMDCLGAAGPSSPPTAAQKCDELLAKCDAGPCKNTDTREETYACYEECIGKVDPACVPVDCYAVNEDCGYDCEDKPDPNACIVKCVKEKGPKCEPDLE